MRVLHQYEIMPDRSPMIVFTNSYKENNRMHLLALRQICKMCLEMVDTRFESLDRKKGLRLKPVNLNALEDAFEEYVVAAAMPSWKSSKTACTIVSKSLTS